MAYHKKTKIGARRTHHSGLNHLMRKGRRLAAGQNVKNYARKVSKLDTMDALIAIGGGGAVGYMAGGALADGLDVQDGTGGHKLIRFGSTAIGAMIGVNLMS